MEMPRASRWPRFTEAMTIFYAAFTAVLIIGRVDTRNCGTVFHSTTSPFLFPCVRSPLIAVFLGCAVISRKHCIDGLTRYKVDVANALANLFKLLNAPSF